MKKKLAFVLLFLFLTQTVFIVNSAFAYDAEQMLKDLFAGYSIITILIFILILAWIFMPVIMDYNRYWSKKNNKELGEIKVTLQKLEEAISNFIKDSSKPKS